MRDVRRSRRGRKDCEVVCELRTMEETDQGMNKGCAEKGERRKRWRSLGRAHAPGAEGLPGKISSATDIDGEKSVKLSERLTRAHVSRRC